MERIQSAIAKARAARNAARADPPPPLVLSPEAAVEPAAAPPAAVAPPVPEPAARAAIDARWSALPGFAPSGAQMARQHVVTFVGGREAVHFDMLRTRILQQMRGNGWTRVAITSPGPSCGKSTVALNLAFSLARQGEVRTLLAEMDLRRPSLARMLGLREKHQFAEVLAGQADLAAHAVRYGPNLAIATQTGPARHPAELLHSPAMAAALDRIEADWVPDVVLCDLPPLFAADDAMAVLGQVDAALIVVAAGSTTVGEIDRCEREVAAQTNVLGMVLNKCRYMDKDYGYDYYG